MPTPRLQDYVRVYDDGLPAELCREMIASFESSSGLHQANGRRYKAGLEDSAWTELNVTRAAEQHALVFFRQRIDASLARYNRDLGLPIAIPNSQKTADLILKRYRVGANERFQLHFDALNEVSNRYLVLLWYLNDVTEGGETVFPDLELAIAPRAGRLLMFPPYWMYQHAGRPPVSGAKYILSTYLLF